jgi:hypothetical protein
MVDKVASRTAMENSLVHVYATHGGVQAADSPRCLLETGLIRPMSKKGARTCSITTN